MSSLTAINAAHWLQSVSQYLPQAQDTQGQTAESERERFLKLCLKITEHDPCLTQQMWSVLSALGPLKKQE